MEIEISIKLLLPSKVIVKVSMASQKMNFRAIALLTKR